MDHKHLAAADKDIEFVGRFNKDLAKFVQQYQGKPVFPAGFAQATVPGTEASHMRAEDCIVGVTVEGESRAYPYWIADKFHTINDTLGGERVLVTC